MLAFRPYFAQEEAKMTQDDRSTEENRRDDLSPKGKPRLRLPVRDQIELRPTALDELLDPDHEARTIWDCVCGLDLSDFLGSIKAVEGARGRDATDPRILLALWLYATLKGVGSARQLARLCTEHVAYQWICGAVSLNHKTLSDFRSAQGEQLRNLLKQISAALMHEGLVTMDRVSIDGMRVRANAGKSSFRRPKSLKKCEKEAERQLRALERELEKTPDEIDRRRRGAKERATREKKARIEKALEHQRQLAQQREKRQKGSGEDARASTTDPEARTMKFSNGGYNPGYNVQFCTDNQSGVIVGVDVTNSGSDRGQLSPMAKQIEEAYRKSPKEYLADGGFAALNDIDDLEVNHEAKVYAPVKHEKEKLRKGQDPYAPAKHDTDATAAWKARMATAEAKEIYKERAAVAEWVNAMCRNRNFWFFPTRGLRKAQAVATLFALTHNVMQAIRLRAAPAAH